MLISLILNHKLKKQSNKKFFIIPKPQNTSFQKIIFEKLLFAKPNIFKEEKFSNRFYYLKLDEVKDKTNIYYFSFLRLGRQKKPIKITQAWLEKDRFINPNHPEIQKLAKKLKRNSDFETIKSAFEFTVEKLRYAEPIKGLYRLEDALEVFSGKRKGVDCGGFSVFLISLLRSLKIPCRLVVGFVIKHKALKILNTFDFCLLTFNFLSMHAWVEAFSKEKGLLYLDPSVEWRKRKGLTKRPSFSKEPFADRIVFSYGEDFYFKNFKIDLLQNAFYL